MTKIIANLSSVTESANKLDLSVYPENLQEKAKEYYVKSAFAIAAREVLNQTKDTKFFTFSDAEKLDITDFNAFMSGKPEGSKLTYSEIISNKCKEFWKDNNGGYLTYKTLPYVNYQWLVDETIEEIKNKIENNELTTEELFSIVKFMDKHTKELDIEGLKTEERSRRSTYGDFKELNDQWKEIESKMIVDFGAPEKKIVQYAKMTIRRKIENMYDVEITL